MPALAKENLWKETQGPEAHWEKLFFRFFENIFSSSTTPSFYLKPWNFHRKSVLNNFLMRYSDFWAKITTRKHLPSYKLETWKFRIFFSSIFHNAIEKRWDFNSEDFSKYFRKSWKVFLSNTFLIPLRSFAPSFSSFGALFWNLKIFNFSSTKALILTVFRLIKIKYPKDFSGTVHFVGGLYNGCFHQISAPELFL